MAKETEFSIYAQALAVYYKGEKKPPEFVRDLFAHIHKGAIDKTDPHVSDADARTLKGYYYANSDITEMAKHIAGDLDIGEFAKYVQLKSDDSVMSLCETFKRICPDITEETYGIVLAEKFQEIIEKAAKPKKRGGKEKSTGATNTHVSVTTDKYGIYLLAEEGCMCPNDGCTHMLYVNDGNNSELVYKVEVIDPNRPSDDPDNLIALCPECAAKYRMQRAAGSIQRMKDIKAKLQQDTADKELISDQKLQEGVRRVIAKIPQMQPQGPIDLNLDPVAVRSKIEPDNIALYLKIKTQVNFYFNIVHETFQQMGREGQLRFQPFCAQVKLNYIQLREEGRGQEEIYRKLTDWLQNATNEERDCCEIVISYFVQKCEVFDVITE